MEFAPDSCSVPPLAAGESCSCTGFCFPNPVSKSQQKQHKRSLISHEAPRLHADIPGHLRTSEALLRQRWAQLGSAAARGRSCSGPTGHSPGWGRGSGAPPRRVTTPARRQSTGTSGSWRTLHGFPRCIPGFRPGEPRAAGAEALDEGWKQGDWLLIAAISKKHGLIVLFLLTMQEMLISCHIMESQDH